MARVFVSHAGADTALAVQVHRWLVADGHQVFLDRDLADGILVGEKWQKRLHERLRWADAVVCLLSSAYLASVWCTAELAIAQTRGSRLLPVRGEPGVDHPLLEAVQQADAARDMCVAREKLAEALRRLDDAGGAGWPDDRSPFPGLRPFDIDLHRVFFGRTREIEQLATLLRSPGKRAEGAVLLVVGPSGCGKSSLVRAGLLPVMVGEPGWQTMRPILPGTDPVAALTRALAATASQLGTGWSTADVRHRLDDGGLAELANDLLLGGPGPRRTHLLIAIDQFEELLTQAAPTERAQFAQLLAPALAGPVLVVGTLRPEFLDQLLGDPDLAGLSTRIHTLRPLRRDALRSVIEGPARLAGIGVDEDLVARLVTDTDTGEALPLLAYTLAQLAEGVGREGRLSASRYEQLGGVRGALVAQADAALAAAAAASGRDREQVVTELLRLVTVDEQGRPTRWRIRRNELPNPVPTELDTFVARRLLTTDLENGEVVIGVAHEAFLSAWPPLAGAITAASSALRARRQIEQAAADWLQHGKPPDRLWERGQLAAALAATGAHVQRDSEPCAAAIKDETSPSVPRSPSHFSRSSRRVIGRDRVLVTDRVEVNPPARQFLLASMRRDKWRRSRSIAILSTLLVLALVAAGVAVVQRQAAEDGQRLATARQLLSKADAALNSGDPRTALLLGEAANRIHPDPETRASLRVLLSNTHLSGVLAGHTAGVAAVAFAPDGRTLATASTDHTVLVWDVSDPARPRRLGDPLTGHSGVVWAVAFTPDGRILATAGDDKTVLLWDVSDPARPRRLGDPLTGHNGTVDGVAFAPDGHTLATASWDKTVLVWDVSDPARPRRLGDPLTGHSGAVTAMAFAPDGHTLATASTDHTVLLWDVSNPARPRRLGDPLTSHTNAIYAGTAVAFAPDGHTLATASWDKTVLLWDVSDPARPRRLGDPLTGHTDAVTAVAFAPDGHTLATASWDKTVLLWDVSDPARPRRLGGSLTGHTDAVTAVAFAPDGHTLATASDDNTLLLWDIPGPARRLGDPLTGHTVRVTEVAFAPDGHTLATASWDKTVLLWDVTDPARPRRLGDPLTGHTDAVVGVAFAPDGRTLATAGDDNTVLLWDVTDPARPRRLGDPLTGHTDAVTAVAFAPDGHTLATASDDNTLLLWDASDPARPRRLGDPLTGHNSTVDGVAFAPDGHTLATASWDKTVLLWDVTDPARPRRLGDPLTGHTDAVVGVAFAPDGHTLATASWDKTVLLWDVTDPARPRRLGDPLTSHTDAIYAVAFAPDGHTLATAPADNTVLVWDVTDPARPRRLGDPLTSHTDAIYAVTAVAFAPDGRTLATAGDDKTAALWDLSGLDYMQADPLGRACSITGRGLNADEWTRDAAGLPYQDSCAK